VLRKHPLTAPKPRRRRGARLLAVLATVAATVLVTAQSASAAPFFTDYSYPPYSSDPHLTLCGFKENPFRYVLCLYASVDEGSGSNASYPMRRTKLWTIEMNKNWKSASNWTYVGVVANENMIQNPQLNGSHFWAPAGFWDRNWDDSRNLLYVPDVVNGNNNTGSRIFVFEAATANGPYTFIGRLNTPTSGPAAPNGGYASDPFVVRNYNGTPYLFYANGTYDNCGGVSRVKLTPDLESVDTSMTGADMARITFTGGLREDLGNCGTGDPYIEGPAVYNKYELYDVLGRWPTSFAGIDNHEWIMMFSVKPSKIPTRTNPEGTCGGYDQQALAYATAQNLTDTQWTYRGIIMCPRGSEWTNHGSIIRYNHESVILGFHDGPANYHQRRVMLDCLTWDTDDAQLRTVPVSQNNAANCNNWG